MDLEWWGRLFRSHCIWAGTWSKVGEFGLGIGYNLGMTSKLSGLQLSSKVVHLYLGSDFFLKTIDKEFIKKFINSILYSNIQMFKRINTVFQHANLQEFGKMAPKNYIYDKARN
jgi:hypothetical protein